MNDAHSRWVTVVAVVALGGCDTFFRVRGVLTDCRTGQPIPSAVISSRMVRGAGEEPGHDRVNGDGSYDLIMNEPPSASFELSFAASGYRSSTLVVDTTPERGKDLEVCLEPEERQGGARAHQ